MFLKIVELKCALYPEQSKWYKTGLNISCVHRYKKNN